AGERPVAAKDARRPTSVVSVLPLLDPGEYDLTVVWRECQPDASAPPLWALKAVRRASKKFTVYAGEPPAGAAPVALSASDFRDGPVEPAEAARRWAPVPSVKRVQTWGGFAGPGEQPAVGVAAGTFDP